MRLTLRTMLAYLDDLLEPADRDDIGRKIEESEFAVQLMQRIRESARNGRVGAPKLAGKGMGLDPNMVAEYLDNTLAGERVPDFEKACLESNVCLAEVAACHEILTMVLGQPAQINPEMKRRMYGIIEHVQPAAPQGLVGTAAVEHPAISDDLWVKPARRKPEVPDYLRQRPLRSKWKTFVAAGVLVLVLGGAIVMALGPLEHNPVLRWLGFGPAPANQVAANGGTDPTPPVPNGQPANGAAPRPAETNAAAVQPDSNAANETAANQTAPAANIDVVPKSAGNANVTPPTDSLVPPPVPQPPVENVIPNPNATATDATPILPKSEIPRPAETSVQPPQPVAGDPPLRSSPTEAGPVGRFLPSKSVVLLKHDAASNQWLRLPGGETLSAGDQLLVLPTYRPTITLSAGLTLQIPPETLVQLEPPDANGVPGVKLVFGRLVAMTATGKAGSQMRLNVGAGSGLVTFTDADATLGVEVRHSHPPGVDPESQEPRVTAELIAASGHLQWSASDGSPAVNLSGPQRLLFSSNAAEAPAGPPTNAPSLPKWIVPENLNSNEVRASESLVTELGADKPLALALREMANHPRLVEFNFFGAQCLALLGEFDPLVVLFNEPRQKGMWPRAFSSVKSAVSRGPSSAAKVREAFEKLRGEEAGGQLYRMFWGYTKDQLQSGESRKLVDYMAHDNLDFRVLSFTALQEILDKTLLYLPDATVANRRQAWNRWDQEQRKGTIVPREPVAKP